MFFLISLLLTNSWAASDDRIIKPTEKQLILPDCNGQLSLYDHWNNSQNQTFYKHIPLAAFQARAATIGLDQYADLELRQIKRLISIQEVTAQLRKSKFRILEIGGGYGRLVDWVLFSTNLDSPAIHVLEQSDTYFNYLKNKYRKEPTVHITHGSILEPPSQKFDLAFGMFSVFLEFTPEEKILFLKKVFNTLLPHGALVLDVSVVTSLPAQSISSNNYIQFPLFPDDNLSPKLTLHLINEEGITQLAREVGFRSIQCERYYTPTSALSISCILRKSDDALKR